VRVTAWVRSPSIRRCLLVAAVLAGCFVWAMIFVGLSFAMVERGAGQWWVIPLFGASVPAIAALAVRRLPAAPADPAGPAALAGPGGGPALEGPAVPGAGPGARPGVVRRELAEPLSPREREVLGQLASGRTNAEIAKVLFVAPGTVKAHLHHIFRKLDAASRLQAVAHAREAGLLDDEINQR
jgi:DNA-binding CsgD family transcriptional regulator